MLRAVGAACCLLPAARCPLPESAKSGWVTNGWPPQIRVSSPSPASSSRKNTTFFLLNPRYPDFKKVKPGKASAFTFDYRLFQ